MDAEPAPTRRRLHFSGAAKLASATDRTAHLQIYPHMPRGHSHFVVGYGQGTSADNSDQAAHPLSHVRVLRALRKAAQLHTRSLARVSQKNRRGLERNAPGRSKAAP